MRRILVAVVALIQCGVCAAQDRYPSQSVQVISVFGAGGGTDVIARAYAAEMSRLLGQPFVVVNRDGAAGSIGFAALASARPDGHTISFAPSTPLVNSPHIMKNLSYGFDSIVPVCGVFDNVFSIVVAPSSPYKTLKDLLDDARARPGQISFGNAGLGSVPHLSMAALTRAAGVSMNPIAYRGDAGVLPQLMSGELPVGVVAVSSIFGRDLRVLAVFSEKRQRGYPDSPSVTELGFPKIPQGLNGVFVPKGVPKAVLDTLERTCEQVTRTPAFIAVVEKLNQTVEYQTSAEIAKVLKADYEFKGRLLKEIRFGQE
jgi:tripartite-type tricarboxylate transporter receptor subunit TctC